MTDGTLVVATATLLCWAAYLAGEALHVSGVIATVAAGIVFGWYQHVVLAAQIRMQGSAFWRTLVFSLEALVFILIGFSLRGVLERVGGLEAVLTTMAPPVLGVVAAVLLARFVWVFGSDALLTLLGRAGLGRACSRSTGSGRRPRSAMPAMPRPSSRTSGRTSTSSWLLLPPVEPSWSACTAMD